MKRILALVLALILAFSLVGCSNTQNASDPTATPTEGLSSPEPTVAPENPVIRLSTTTSVNDSGLLPFLQPYFESETGYSLMITSAGTGAAIEKGRTGDADCLLVHAKSSEEEFMEEGFSDERVPFMYNYFVITGPAGDPAGVADCASASEAFKAIADSGSTFISRGDNSGTNKAELRIWTAADMDPSGQDWYVSAGAGMGACITMAAEKQAYVLTDKATYLSHEMKAELSLLMEESEEMMNTYAMLAISTEKWPDTNVEGAEAFMSWMTSAPVAELINNYGIEEYGEPLFFVIEG